jgi:hypothetical protein
MFMNSASGGLRALCPYALKLPVQEDDEEEGAKVKDEEEEEEEETEEVNVEDEDNNNRKESSSSPGRVLAQAEANTSPRAPPGELAFIFLMGQCHEIKY